MKSILFSMSLLMLSSLAKADESWYANDAFHFKPHYTVGVGTFPFSDLTLFATAKVSFVDYGPGDEGVQLFALGAAYAKDEVHVMIAPVVLYSGNISLSGDVSLQALGLEQGKKQKLCGITLSYHFD